MPQTETITLRLVAQDLASGKMSAAIGKMDRMAQKGGLVGSAMQGIGLSIGQMINPLALASRGIGLATEAFTGTVRAAADFDAAMTKSTAIMGDLTSAMEEDLANAAREVAKSTTFSATEAADAFFFLASAGLDAVESVEALPRVAQFAQAGMFDLSQATDLLTDAQSALGLTVDDTAENMENMERVADVLVKANTLANASVEQFSTALTSKAGAALKSFGIDVEEGVAVLAAFADQGIKAEEAGNALDRILRLLPDAALKNEAAFREFGIRVFDASGEVRNLGDIVADMEQAFSGLSDAQLQAALSSLGFQARVQGMVKPLIGTSRSIKLYEAELRQAQGTTEAIAKKQLATFNNEMALLGSELQDVAISVGTLIIPALSGMASNVGELIDAAEGLGEAMQPLFDLVELLPEDLRNTFLDNFITTIGPVPQALVNFGEVIGAFADDADADLSRASESVETNLSRMAADVQAQKRAMADAVAGGFDPFAGIAAALSPTEMLKSLRQSLNEANKEVRGILEGGTVEDKQGRDLLGGIQASFQRLLNKLPKALDTDTPGGDLAALFIAATANKVGDQEQTLIDQMESLGLSVNTQFLTSGRLDTAEFLSLFPTPEEQTAEGAAIGQRIGAEEAVNLLSSATISRSELRAALPSVTELRSIGTEVGNETGDAAADAIQWQLRQRDFDFDIGARVVIEEPPLPVPRRPSGRAMGGPVSSGRTYLVGEKGPELLHMGSSGSITPNHKIGGPTINFYGPILGSGRDFVEEVGPELMRWMHRQ